MSFITRGRAHMMSINKNIYDFQHECYEHICCYLSQLNLTLTVKKAPQKDKFIR